MSTEWPDEEGGFEDWQREGMPLEERVQSIILEMDKFNKRKDVSKDEIETMFYDIYNWLGKYESYKKNELVMRLQIAMTYCMVQMADKYLNLFIAMEEPSEESCRIMNSFLDILGNKANMSILFGSGDAASQKKAREEILSRVQEADLSIASHHPEVIE